MWQHCDLPSSVSLCCCGAGCLPFSFSAAWIIYRDAAGQMNNTEESWGRDLSGQRRGLQSSEAAPALGKVTVEEFMFPETITLFRSVAQAVLYIYHHEHSHFVNFTWSHYSAARSVLQCWVCLVWWIRCDILLGAKVAQFCSNMQRECRLAKWCKCVVVQRFSWRPKVAPKIVNFTQTTSTLLSYLHFVNNWWPLPMV